MKKEIKRIIINFNDINKKCDSEYQKLSDKCKNYELSHNRKWQLLNKIAEHWNIKKETELKTNQQITEHAKEWKKIINEIEIELKAMLRVKSKPIIKNKITTKNLRKAFQAARWMKEKKND